MSSRKSANESTLKTWQNDASDSRIHGSNVEKNQTNHFWWFQDDFLRMPDFYENFNPSKNLNPRYCYLLIQQYSQRDFCTVNKRRRFSTGWIFPPNIFLKNQKMTQFQNFEGTTMIKTISVTMILCGVFSWIKQKINYHLLSLKI